MIIDYVIKPTLKQFFALSINHIDLFQSSLSFTFVMTISFIINVWVSQCNILDI